MWLGSGIAKPPTFAGRCVRGVGNQNWALEGDGDVNLGQTTCTVMWFTHALFLCQWDFCFRLTDEKLADS
jgi:hypothetical protein